MKASIKKIVQNLDVLYGVTTKEDFNEAVRDLDLIAMLEDYEGTSGSKMIDELIDYYDGKK